MHLLEIVVNSVNFTVRLSSGNDVLCQIVLADHIDDNVTVAHCGGHRFGVTCRKRHQTQLTDISKDDRNKLSMSASKKVKLFSATRINRRPRRNRSHLPYIEHRL